MQKAISHFIVRNSNLLLNSTYTCTALIIQRKQTLKEPDKRCNGIASIYCGDSVLVLHEGFFCKVTQRSNFILGHTS